MKKDCPLRIAIERKSIVTKGTFDVIENGDTQLIQIEWNHKLVTKDQKKTILKIEKHIRSLLKQQFGQGGN